MLRLAMGLILGGWLLGTLMVAGIAAQNFRMVDRLLHSASQTALQQRTAGIPAGEVRLLLRHLASELNRFYFRAWGWVELVLGAGLLLCAMGGFQDRRLTAGFAVMLGLVAVGAFYLVPRLIEVGRSLDFVPREPVPPALVLFGRLHAAYTGLDIVKLLVGIWMAVVLVRLGPGTD
ncbi:MAG: hypothetical protein HY647_03725 [Acidobacteria bacterium]|nr:hypothetical protein [Acidobacteriota bacterium]